MKLSLTEINLSELVQRLEVIEQHALEISNETDIRIARLENVLLMSPKVDQDQQTICKV